MRRPIQRVKVYGVQDRRSFALAKLPWVDREEGFGLRGEHGLLLAEVFDASREDRSIWRAGVAEASDVCLAERPLPGEGLAGNGLGASAVTLAFSDLRQVVTSGKSKAIRAASSTLTILGTLLPTAGC